MGVSRSVQSSQPLISSRRSEKRRARGAMLGLLLFAAMTAACRFPDTNGAEIHGRVTAVRDDHMVIELEGGEAFPRPGDAVAVLKSSTGGGETQHEITGRVDSVSRDSVVAEIVTVDGGTVRAGDRVTFDSPSPQTALDVAFSTRLAEVERGSADVARVESAPSRVSDGSPARPNTAVPDVAPVSGGPPPTRLPTMEALPRFMADAHTEEGRVALQDLLAKVEDLEVGSGAALGDMTLAISSVPALARYQRTFMVRELIDVRDEMSTHLGSFGLLWRDSSLSAWTYFVGERKNLSELREAVNLAVTSEIDELSSRVMVAYAAIGSEFSELAEPYHGFVRAYDRFHDELRELTADASILEDTSESHQRAADARAGIADLRNAMDELGKEAERVRDAWLY